MNHFLERLPWRVAALAGLLVGGISLAVGIDLWTCLLRVGAAFVVFGAAGLGLRAILTQDTHPVTSVRKGHHFDQTTPADSPGESASDSSESPSSTSSGDSSQ